MLYLVKIICYFVIVSLVEFRFSACLSLTQEEYNIIANSPLKLVCNVEAAISNGVTINTPDNTAVVSCTPTIAFPPSPATCSSSGVYTGNIDETANTVTLTTTTLPGDVNGTWSCSHGLIVSTIVFPNPIPCLVSENFALSPSSLTANVTSDTPAFSLTATYSCINVDVSFKWILKAGISHEFTSSSVVSKDSSTCTDTVSCSGINAYTQTVSSESIFQFATAQNLFGGYELSAEAFYTNGIIALKSHSIGYFEFSEPVSTPIPTTTPLSDQRCSSMESCVDTGLIVGISAGIILGLVICIISIICICVIRRKRQNKKNKNDSNPSSDLNGAHSIDLNPYTASDQQVQMETLDDTLKLKKGNENGGAESQRIPQQSELESNSGANKEKTTSKNVQLENVPDKTVYYENKQMEKDATNEFAADQPET